MAIKCWVVMGNDYPAAVLASEASADEYILFRKWSDLVMPYYSPKSHWRHYEMELDTEFVPVTLRPGQGKKLPDMTTEELRSEWFYWFRRESKNGAAARCSADFRREVEKELRRRNIKVSESLVSHYIDLVGTQHGDLPVGSGSARGKPLDI